MCSTKRLRTVRWLTEDVCTLSDPAADMSMTCFMCILSCPLQARTAESVASGGSRSTTVSAYASLDVIDDQTDDVAMTYLMTYSVCIVFPSQVRTAAIGSIGRLAKQSRVFRDKAADVLVDMLSDEIDSVRMAAITSLGQLRKHLELSEEHLQVHESTCENAHLLLHANSFS